MWNYMNILVCIYSDSLLVDKIIWLTNCSFTNNQTISCLFYFPRINKMSSQEPFIRSRQMEKEVNGILTQVVCTEFSNYIFIVLTQYSKIGTLISVTPDSRSNDISTPTFSTKVLLGKDEVRWMKLWNKSFRRLHSISERLVKIRCNSFHAARAMMWFWTSVVNGV